MRESKGVPKPQGAMKVKVGAGRPRWDPAAPRGGRTTGPSHPFRRGGGARAYVMVPERW